MDIYFGKRLKKRTRTRNIKKFDDMNHFRNFTFLWMRKQHLETRFGRLERMKNKLSDLILENIHKSNRKIKSAKSYNNIFVLKKI
jgi:hypothetical protein